MKRKHFLACAAIAIALTGGTILFIAARPHSTTNPEPKGHTDGARSADIRSITPDRSPPPQATTASHPATETSKSVTIAPTRLETVVAAEGAGTPAQIVRVPAGKVLATVGQVTLILKDLLPLKSSEAATEQIMSPGMFQSLLERAINRELTFQTARASGVELTPEQVAQREQVRQTIVAAQGEAGKVVHLNGSSTLEEQIEFEQRDATSQLLLNSLLSKAGVPSPHVTDSQVRQYYDAHRQEFSPLPGSEQERTAAWEKIDLEIRNKLAPQMQAKWQKGMRQYLESLRAKANVTLATL